MKPERILLPFFPCLRWNGGNIVPYRPLISIAPPDPRRILPVAPLIGDKRCYGEYPVRLRGDPRDGLVQG
jgi:hypothetical protein